MAIGLPAVVTAVGGNPEVVVDGVTGLLVPAGDPPALAQAILRVAAAPELARDMGRAARARVEARFEVRHMVRAYERLYEEVWAGKRAAPRAAGARS